MTRGAIVRPLALAGGALAAGMVLMRLGSVLPLPHSVHRDEIARWVQQQGAAAATFAIARLAGVVLSAYAATIGVIGALASASRVASLRRLVDRVTLPSLRPLIAPVLAAGLTLAAAAPAGAQSRGEPNPRPPVMRVVDTDSSSVDPPVMRVVMSTPTPTSVELPTHTVAPGDTFWSIAEHALRSSRASATDADIVPYWRRLIEANRDRLTARDEPDLIYPGQVFVLPPIS